MTPLSVAIARAALAEQKLENAIFVLRHVEWAGRVAHHNFGTVATCPYCGAEQDKTPLHYRRCLLYAFIADSRDGDDSAAGQH